MFAVGAPYPQTFRHLSAGFKRKTIPVTFFFLSHRHKISPEKTYGILPKITGLNHKNYRIASRMAFIAAARSVSPNIELPATSVSAPSETTFLAV